EGGGEGRAGGGGLEVGDVGLDQHLALVADRAVADRAAATGRTGGAGHLGREPHRRGERVVLRVERGEVPAVLAGDLGGERLTRAEAGRGQAGEAGVEGAGEGRLRPLAVAGGVDARRRLGAPPPPGRPAG